MLLFGYFFNIESICQLKKQFVHHRFEMLGNFDYDELLDKCATLYM